LGLQVVNLSVHVARRAKVPLTIYSQLDGATREAYDRSFAQSKLGDNFHHDESRWVTFDSASLDENLHRIPADSLVVVGAAGESLMRELVFGSKLETIQKSLPNPALVVGPQCKAQCL
jgi:hypothetical protein